MGPLPGSQWALDVHEDDALCWRYTAVMVVIQMLIFGRVSGNRVTMKHASAVRVEREKLRRDRSFEGESKLKSISNEPKMKLISNGLDGAYEVENCRSREAEVIGIGRHCEAPEVSDGSTTEMSEEEIIV